MASVSRCAHAAAHAAAAAAAVPRRATGLPAAQRAPILDFLLPSFVRSSSSRSSRSYSTACARRPISSQQPTPSPRRPARPLARSSCSSSPSFAAATTTQHTRRSFSATARRRSTQTLLNPQTDDDGNEMRLEITPRAAKRLAKVMAKDGNPRLALRIQVESGGCHGFQYLMSLVTLPEQLPGPDEAGGPDGEEPVIRDDDTIFVYAEDGEAPPTDLLSAPKIILDTPSLELLRGSKVDFTTELIGSQFKITDNPLATSSCGCGTSFDIKV